MSIPNAYCKKHDEIEPQDHSFEVDGLWTCPKCYTKNNIKSIDITLKKIKEEYEKKSLLKR